MASFTPVRGTRNEINAVSMVDGQFLYETDQGDGNRIYADIIDSNGNPKRVQVGGERGDQNRLVYLKDVALTNPQNNDYLKYDSVNQKWVNKLKQYYQNNVGGCWSWGYGDSDAYCGSGDDEAGEPTAYGYLHG